MTKQRWLDKLLSDYALFKIQAQIEFILIQCKGKFKDKYLLLETVDKNIQNLKNFDSLIQEVQSGFDEKLYFFYDREKNPQFWLMFKINPNLHQEGFIDLAFIAFLKEIAYINNKLRKLPIWYQDILWNNIPKNKFLFIQSEIGSREILFTKTLLRIKFPDRKILLFEPSRLSHKIQSYELFGIPPGERYNLKTSIPIINSKKECIVIKEISYLTEENQRRLFHKLSNDNWNDTFWIFTSHYDLKKLVENGMFLFELYEIIKNQMVIIPPLRKVRPNELEMEVRKYLNYLKKKYRKKVDISEEVLDILKKHNWPGNLTEFYKTIETAFFLTMDEVITKNHVKLQLWELYEKTDLELRKHIEELEKKLILIAYRMTGGNYLQMARALGISRGSLQYKLHKYNFYKK
ncbi:MAG: hypothetical protein NZ853_05200 [Leptospiraceae bacterium]|nr:hypothetical protein [Leptospiraceae bacterium]MDW7976656.1 helix-turn-helix domain-containing protein [Leptospiraceae bacterium]